MFVLLHIDSLFSNSLQNSRLQNTIIAICGCYGCCCPVRTVRSGIAIWIYCFQNIVQSVKIWNSRQLTSKFLNYLVLLLSRHSQHFGKCKTWHWCLNFTLLKILLPNYHASGHFIYNLPVAITWKDLFRLYCERAVFPKIPKRYKFVLILRWLVALFMVLTLIKPMASRSFSWWYQTHADIPKSTQ